MSQLTTGNRPPTTGNSDNVLPVDDDNLLRGFYVKALCRTGYQVTLARGGRNALETFHAPHDEGSPSDLVLMDLHIPGMGSAASAKSLLQIEQEAPIPLISSNRDLDLGDLNDRGLGVMFPGLVSESGRLRPSRSACLSELKPQSWLRRGNP